MIENKKNRFVNTKWNGQLTDRFLTNYVLAIENRFVNKKTKKERSTYGPISHELLVIENRFVKKNTKIPDNLRTDFSQNDS